MCWTSLLKIPRSLLSQEFLDSAPGLQGLWLFLSWFFQLISPVSLFPVEGGHRAMVMMKLFSGCRVKDKAPHSLDQSKYFHVKLQNKFLRKVRLQLCFMII